MPKLAMKVLGVYKLTVTEELVKEQTALIFPGKLDGFPRQRAEQRSRDLLASTVLVEVLVRHCDDTFSAGDFTQPQKRKPRKSWQVAWEEKYLSKDGTSCLTARWPDPPIERDFRIAFFLHCWNPDAPLYSSCGELKCPPVKTMPERLQNLVPYRPVD